MVVHLMEEELCTVSRTETIRRGILGSEFMRRQAQPLLWRGRRLTRARLRLLGLMLREWQWGLGPILILLLCTVGTYRKLERVILPVRSRQETLLPVRCRQETLHPVKSRQETLLPVRRRQETLLPVRCRQETLHPVKSRQETLLPVRRRQETLHPVRTGQLVS
jgi:hypothetical protein